MSDEIKHFRIEYNWYGDIPQTTTIAYREDGSIAQITKESVQEF